tara:strand:- start:590 stop:1336 length:747 start_codon:yes stop_codon:yes gene_type:complete
MSKYLAFLILSLFLNSKDSDIKRTIILSKASENYIDWIIDKNVILLDAYTIKNTDSILHLADGIILTGGEDINPLEYNDTTNIKMCGDIDYERDTLERKLFDFALNSKIPLIGICRGMQMMNVASGGSLYGDIPTEIGTKVIHRNNGEVMHQIALCDTSTLIFPKETDTIMVNSWHHQGLKMIPNHLRVIARSYDSLPEAVVMDKSVHPFMIAVQFHPERLAEDNIISQTMKYSFYKQVDKFVRQKKF